MRRALLNRKQLQLNVCRAIMDSDRRCHYCEVDDNVIAVTIDGYVAYIFDKNECVFNFEKITKAPGLKCFFEDFENDVEINSTDELYNVGGGLIAEKYKGNDFEILVNTEIAKQFKDCKLYANGGRSRILVKDYFDRVVGSFLPMKPDCISRKE